MFGLAHLIGEGIFVATLAALEWQTRRTILGIGFSEAQSVDESAR